MTTLAAAFAEYTIKFIVLIACAVVGVVAGAKLKASKKSK